MASKEDIELNRIRLEIEHERDMTRALQESVAEWKLTVAELEKQADSVDEEETEWKTRYENQTELNAHLSSQEQHLTGLVAREKDRIRRLQKGLDIDLDELTETEVKKMTTSLARDKYHLESQLRDYEWRLDQEGKAYSRLDEKRKALSMDMKKTKQDVVAEQEQKCTQKLERKKRNLERELKVKTTKLQESRDTKGYAAQTQQRLKALRKSKDAESERKTSKQQSENTSAEKR